MGIKPGCPIRRRARSNELAVGLLGNEGVDQPEKDIIGDGWLALLFHDIVSPLVAINTGTRPGLAIRFGRNVLIVRKYRSKELVCISLILIDCRGKRQRSSARHVLAPELASVKMGRIKSVQPGHIAGAEEIRFAARIPAMEGPVNACRAIRLRAHGLVISWNLPDVFGCQISMLDENRSIDQADLHLCRAAGTFHHSGELN